MSKEFVVGPDSNDSETTASPAGAPAAWSSLDRGWVRDLACCLLLVFLVFFFFWRILTPNPSDRRSFPPGDFVVTFYAVERVKAEMLLQGEPPLWNPHANSGHPLLADPQVALYYPPSLVTVLLGARGGLSVFALQLEAVLHFCLAALFTFALARRVLGHRGGALMAAIGFTFGGYLTGYPALQLAILRTVVWLPLILLGLEAGASHLRSGNRRAWAAFAGAGLVSGLAVLAGHAQSAMYVLYASLAYLLVRLWGRRNGRQILAAAGLYVAVGVGISAAQWLPSLEYMHLSTRSGMAYAQASGGFELVDALQIVLPTQSPLYAGVLTLLLALSAPILVRARMVRFWAGLGLVGLLLSFGGNLFLYPAFYLLAPGFALFRSQERAVFVPAFALAMLAGYGFAFLAERPAPAWLRRLATYAAVGSMVLVAMGYFGWLASGEQGPSAFYWFLQQSAYLTIFLGLAALLLKWQAQPGRQQVAMAAVLALVVLDLFTVNATRNLDRRLPEAHTVPSPLVEEMQADDGLFRIYDEFRLLDNLGSLFGLEDTRGASPLKLERYRRLLQDLPIERAWQLLNVKYVTTWRETLNVPSEILAEEGDGEGATYLHRLVDPGPRAWVVHEVEIVPGDDQAVERLSDWQFAPLDAAILSEPLNAPLVEAGDLDASTVRWVLREPAHLKLSVDLPADGLLVLGEVYYPGWRTYVDGRPVPTLRANLALRAVPVPAGQHQVEMVYRPWTVPAGIIIAVLALVGTLAVIAVSMRNGRWAGDCPAVLR